jgi:hypothetical protein
VKRGEDGFLVSDLTGALVAMWMEPGTEEIEMREPDELRILIARGC